MNFYRAVQSREPQAIAASVALVFMGTRLESWPADRQAAMAAFFSQVGYKPTGEWKEEIVYFDADKPPDATPRTLALPDGTAVRVGAGEDPREAFAAWLVSPREPVVRARRRQPRLVLADGPRHRPRARRHPPGQRAVNAALLALLEREFQASRFDVKQLYRLILNSSTYQLSSIPAAPGPEAEANFAYTLARPLDAEVLVDAVCAVTGTSEQYSSAIPEPYTYIPPNVRSIALPDGSIRSAFLETFGRPPRDTGLLSERNGRPSASQRLYMLNSSDVQRKIQQGPKIQALLQTRGTATEMVTAFYLAILSRLPTSDEVAAGDGVQPRRRARTGARPGWTWRGH